MLPLGVRRLSAHASTRNAHYCYVTVTNVSAAAVEANIEVLDEDGAVLLTVEGLRLGSGATAGGHRERLLNERLLTIDWRRQDRPEAAHVDAGRWLLIATSDAAQAEAARMADALTAADAQVTTTVWPADAPDSVADEVRSRLTADHHSGVVVVTAAGGSAEQAPTRGADQVRHLVRIARELPEIPGEPPRLFVLTRNAQTVLDGDVANLEHAGLRGLMRVLVMEHPSLRPTQVDLDDATAPEYVAAQLLSESEEDETAWRGGEFHVARLALSPLRPEERRTAVVDHETGGMRLQIRTPGDLESLELAAFDRVPRGRAKSRSR